MESISQEIKKITKIKEIAGIWNIFGNSVIEKVRGQRNWAYVTVLLFFIRNKENISKRNIFALFLTELGVICWFG